MWGCWGRSESSPSSVTVIRVAGWFVVRGFFDGGTDSITGGVDGEPYVDTLAVHVARGGVSRVTVKGVTVVGGLEEPILSLGLAKQKGVDAVSEDSDVVIGNGRPDAASSVRAAPLAARSEADRQR